MNPSKYNLNKIHFIGVGGAGMSGIAEILLNLKKYSGLGCNNYQSLILPFLQVDRKFWIQFFNNNDCTCINFLFHSNVFNER